MDSRDWQFIAPVIANKSYKAITLDVRGAGKSPVPSEPIDYVEDLKKLLDHLDIHEAVLVGHSLGGMIATDFTLMYPNRVSQLIWIASWPLRISIFRP
jgi:pimeloyl-ACP methyl ester carboxylesterase